MHTLTKVSKLDISMILVGNNLNAVPANAISGTSGGGNEDETFAAAKNSNLFLNTCKWANATIA